MDDRQLGLFEAKREAIETRAGPAAGAVGPPRGDPEGPRHPGEVLGQPLSARGPGLGFAVRRPRVAYGDLMRLPGVGPGVADPEVAEQLEIQGKYAGYIDRQGDEIQRQRSQDAQPVPGDFDFQGVRGLSAEVREKLTRVRPVTLGQAARIPGVTPAAVSLLLIHLKRRGAG